MTKTAAHAMTIAYVRILLFPSFSSMNHVIFIMVPLLTGRLWLLDLGKQIVSFGSVPIL